MKATLTYLRKMIIELYRKSPKNIFISKYYDNYKNMGGKLTLKQLENFAKK